MPSVLAGMAETVFLSVAIRCAMRLLNEHLIDTVFAMFDEDGSHENAAHGPKTKILGLFSHIFI